LKASPKSNPKSNPTLKVLNKIFKTLLWVLIALATLIILVAVLLYVPAVQRFAVGEIEKTVENTTGMKLSVGRFALRFPLGVGLDDTSIVTPAGDTLVSLGQARLGVAVWPLLAREVHIPHVSAENIRVAYRDTTTTALFAARLARLDIKGVKVKVDLQEVAVVKVKLTRGFYSYLTSPNPPPEPPTPPADPFSWSVRVGTVKLIDNSARYGTAGATPQKGFDPEYIAVDSLQMVVKEVIYNQDISARLRRLELRERSGLKVTAGEGDFAMTAEGFSLTDLELATPNSSISGSAQVGAGITEMALQTPLSATIKATVGASDIFLFAPPLDATTKRALAGKTIVVEGDLAGTLADISINHLTATVPRTVTLSARGNVTSLVNLDRLGGRFSFNGEVQNVDFARDYIADTALRRRIGFPDRMTFAGRATFTPSVYDLPEFRLTTDGGRLTATGRFDSRKEEYRASVSAKDFPLHSFLPHDSLGVATFSLTASGRGFEPANMTATAEIDIERFDYKDYNFGAITAQASIAEGQIAGAVDSHSEALVFGFALDGHISPNEYVAHLAGKIDKADLYGMGLATDALAVTSVVDIAASSSPNPGRLYFTARATLDSTIVHYGDATQRITTTHIEASTDTLRTVASVRSGDLSVDFTSPAAIDSLAECFTAAWGELSRQLANRDLRMDSLRVSLPELRLTASAGRDNVLWELARAGGMDFQQLTASLSARAGEPFRAGVELNGIHTGTLTLDTINVWARQRGDQLRYSMRLANRPGNTENLALIYAFGNVEQNRARLNVLQRNQADSVGFSFGIEAQLLDSVIRASVVSSTPTLGYEQWSVNEGNYFSYGFDGSLSANLRLTGPHHNRIDLQSVAMKDIPGALSLVIEGLEIDHLLELVPTAPPVGGLLSTDVAFGLHEGAIATTGTVGVDELDYNGIRVSDIDAWVDFYFESSGRMALNSSVDIDQTRALTAKGTYLTAGEGEMDFEVGVPALPLSVANAFVPGGMASLSGNLDAHLSVKGSPSAPVISGDAGFTDGKIAVEMTGTDLGLSTDRITVADGRVAFNGFGLTAPNGQRMRITGGVDISDFDNMRADLAVVARNFEAINSTHIGGSQVYGKAAFDANVTARGPVDALTIRGNVKLLASTNVTYIMRDQMAGVSDQTQDVVDFMVFADSIFMTTYAPVENLRPASRVDMLVGVEIEEGLRANVSLDELGESRVALVGSGQLNYSMNSEGDVRLSGRYTLSGGTVVYSPPLISRKVFDVRDGSYVAFTGDMTDPEFHITASQTMTVDVDMGAGPQPANMIITISIVGSLHGMQITFDMTSPSNATIQSQLMSMAPEQRMQQALSLLLYNQYTAPGATTAGAGFDARDQLGSFIAKEVNQWARNNLRVVDLSVGVGSSQDKAGNHHTDYSYSVSKKLFNDRVTVKIGGSVSDNATTQSFSDNLLNDLSLEYRLTKRDNLFLKVYRDNTQETIFEGEVTETGVGFLMRKKINRLRDLFRLQNKRKRKTKERLQL
jgi:hypothetical protein